MILSLWSQMEDLKRLTINLALFSTDQPSRNSNSVQRTSRSFERTEVVGLGIVAAMSELETSSNNQFPAAALLSVAVPKSIGASKSIPINSSGAGALAFGFRDERVGGVEDKMMEMSESYICVISQIGNDRVRKREYFENRLLSTTTAAGSILANSRSSGTVSRGVFSRSFVEVAPEETPFWEGVDFLSWCFLCRKDLDGIDIFMYRGEKAFCSVECRDVQIATDKHKQKRGRVLARSMEHPESPCCSPMLSYTGVLAA